MSLDVENQMDKHAMEMVLRLKKENEELRARISVLEAQLREANRR